MTQGAVPSGCLKAASVALLTTVGIHLRSPLLALFKWSAEMFPAYPVVLSWRSREATLIPPSIASGSSMPHPFSLGGPHRALLSTLVLTHARFRRASIPSVLMSLRFLWWNSVAAMKNGAHDRASCWLRVCSCEYCVTLFLPGSYANPTGCFCQALDCGICLYLPPEVRDFGVRTWPRYFAWSSSRITGRVTRSVKVSCGTDTLNGYLGPPFFGMYMCLHLGALRSIPYAAMNL
jgi:hypothetical protein